MCFLDADSDSFALLKLYYRIAKIYWLGTLVNPIEEVNYIKSVLENHGGFNLLHFAQQIYFFQVYYVQ